MVLMVKKKYFRMWPTNEMGHVCFAQQVVGVRPKSGTLERYPVRLCVLGKVRCCMQHLDRLMVYTIAFLDPLNNPPPCV